MTAQSDDQPTVKAEEAGSIPITKLIISSKDATECLWFSHATILNWVCEYAWFPPPPPPPPRLCEYVWPPPPSWMCKYVWFIPLDMWICVIFPLGCVNMCDFPPWMCAYVIFFNFDRNRQRSSFSMYVCTITWVTCVWPVTEAGDLYNVNQSITMVITGCELYSGA